MELPLPLLKMAQPPEGIRRGRKTQTFTATMDTMVTTLDLAMRSERPTTFWAIPSHTMAPTDLGATGGNAVREARDHSARRGVRLAGAADAGKDRHSARHLLSLVPGGPEALEDQQPKPNRVWNRIPDDVRERIIRLALDEPALSPRELPVRFTDTKGFGRGQTILLHRERIKRQTITQRRLLHQQQAA